MKILGVSIYVYSNYKWTYKEVFDRSLVGVRAERSSQQISLSSFDVVGRVVKIDEFHQRRVRHDRLLCTGDVNQRQTNTHGQTDGHT